MKKQYDFSTATRGKFYHPDARLNLPVYLEEEVRQFVAVIAERKHSDVNEVVNALLRSDIGLAKAMQ
ncbi:MAG: hypothetical protein HN919_22945 [Verrucomicrobia bacterium]|jgi:hypothetical protein|nr:hypothetical protein [Verrucomicrobiota bacterium]MBT7069171.1 hypothetical protein [Verrucomicrobiota bacterium]MBT7699605.1 hypothetical protein [Verrucomicrobiota bacterium]